MVGEKPIEGPAAQETITEVLSNEDFGKSSTETYWKYIGPEKDETEQGDWEWLWDLFTSFLKGFNKGFANLGALLLWVAGGALLAYLIYLGAKNSGWMHRRGWGHSKRMPPTPDTLFGIPITPDSLPEDLSGAVRDLIKNGELRAVLSLLYRGTLVKHIHQDHIEINGSATEGECLELVIKTCPDRDSRYFKKLTHHWILLAYGHISPEADEIEDLCAEWHQLNSGQSNDG